jgi:isopenicillin-N N-acyltransferase like protein
MSKSKIRPFFRGIGPFCFLLFLSLGILPGQTRQSGPAPARPFYLELSGSAYDRGLQHGKALKSEIAEMIRLWKLDVQQSGKKDPDLVISEFLSKTDFLQAIKKWTPELLEEVRGIGDGSGQPFNTILSYQLVDEIWVYYDELDAQGCSCLGVAKAGTHPAYVGQNMDLESWRHGSQTVLHILQSPDSPEQLIFTSAGLIALNGVNGHSIGVCANTVMELAASRNGLPVAFFIRGLLSKKSEESALDFIKNVRYASGQNYVVGIGDKVYDYETSALKIARYLPLAGGSVVYHTNHAIVNDALKPWWAARLRKLTADELRKTNSYVRLGALKTRLSKDAMDIDESRIKETLRSKDSKEHPVCRPLGNGLTAYTFGSTIMTLSDHPSLQVTVGPPDANDYILFTFQPQVARTSDK